METELPAPPARGRGGTGKVGLGVPAVLQPAPAASGVPRHPLPDLTPNSDPCRRSPLRCT